MIGIGRNKLAFKSESQNRLIVEFLSKSSTSASTIAGGIPFLAVVVATAGIFLCDYSATHIDLLKLHFCRLHFAKPWWLAVSMGAL